MDAFRNTQRPFVAPKSPKTPKTVKPKAPRITRPKLPDPNKVASDQAMSAFRQALAQLQQVTPQVDANAIRAPYQAASVATGQLGGGLQAALLQSGQAAQNQYTQGLGQAQQQAAQFGISAGAGANPTALVNNGSQLIAQQTQAQAAAAPQAATAWQQLLERKAAAEVSDAQLGRSNLISSAQAQLAGNIPSMIADEKDRGFQAKTQRENMGLAYSQLSAKDRQYAQQYGLDALKLRQQGVSDATKNGLDERRFQETQRHNKATEKGAAARAKKAAANGAKGIPQVMGALKIAAGTNPGTEKVAKGWDVDVVTYDPETDMTGTDVQTLHNIKDARPSQQGFAGGVPKTFKIVSSTPAMSTVTTKGTAGRMTLAQWNRAVGIYQQYNGVSRAAAVKAVQGITPRPKK